MSRSSRRMTRREFVGSAVAAVSAVAAAPAILRGQNLNNKLNLAIIGAGGRGAANLKGVGSENIVALCDVNSTALQAAAAQYPQAKTFSDLRKVFDHATRLRCGGRQHLRAHARVLDDAGARCRQARVLREAAGLQHLGDAQDPREGGDS